MASLTDSRVIKANWLAVRDALKSCFGQVVWKTYAKELLASEAVRTELSKIYHEHKTLEEYDCQSAKLEKAADGRTPIPAKQAHLVALDYLVYKVGSSIAHMQKSNPAQAIRGLCETIADIKPSTFIELTALGKEGREFLLHYKEVAQIATELSERGFPINGEDLINLARSANSASIRNNPRGVIALSELRGFSIEDLATLSNAKHGAIMISRGENVSRNAKHDHNRGIRSIIEAAEN